MRPPSDPPPGLIPVPMKGAVLLFTAAEFMNAIRRGKAWRRGLANERRDNAGGTRENLSDRSATN
jgi:hypothetical protein